MIKLDITTTYDMCTTDPSLHDIILEQNVRDWCEETLGYIPELDIRTETTKRIADVYLQLHSETDMLLFRLKFDYCWRTYYHDR